jgi:death on curing protein
MAQPFASAFGRDAYLDVPAKAAAMFRSLVANHPFGNGNKRTAVVTAAHFFLLANGLMLNLSNDQMYEMAKQTARYKLRQLTHDDALAEIAETIRDPTSSLADIRRQAARNKSVAHLYWIVSRMRARIRKEPMNELMPLAQSMR